MMKLMYSAYLYGVTCTLLSLKKNDEMTRILSCPGQLSFIWTKILAGANPRGRP